MSKNYVADRLENIQVSFHLPASREATVDGVTVTEHYAARMDVSAIARGAHTEVRPQIAPQYLGAAKTQPWTIKEIDAAIGNAPLGNIVRNAIRNLYTEWVDEDITAK